MVVWLKWHKKITRNADKDVLMVLHEREQLLAYAYAKWFLCEQKTVSVKFIFFKLVWIYPTQIKKYPQVLFSTYWNFNLPPLIFSKLYIGWSAIGLPMYFKLRLFYVW